MNPPEPWSQAQALFPGSTTGSQYKPAICQYEDKIFLAWATWSNTYTFSYTYWRLSDNGWNDATRDVALADASYTQSHTSALVVFNKVLYAFIPYSSPTQSGCSIFNYDKTEGTFVHIVDWFDTWTTDIAAVVYKDTLYVVGHNPNDGDHLYWTCSNPGVTSITAANAISGFSANTKINESTTSCPALIVRKDKKTLKDKVVLLFLASSDARDILECTLTEGDNPTWNRTDDLEECGNSGVSATSTPDGQHAWLCFKKHNGRTNLMCHYQKNGAWSSNYSMGAGSVLECANEAALVFFDDWVYAVWNTYNDGQTMYWSRRPMKQLNPESWMGDLVNQKISLADLSIPGTHDSAAYKFEIPHTGLIVNSVVGSYVKCQRMSFTEQLNAGIRFFDLRAGYNSSGELMGFHGANVLQVSVEQIFNYFYAWLKDNSTEAIVALVNKEGKNATEQTLSNDLYTMMSSPNAKAYWCLEDTVPTLDQVQGKIQLIRRIPHADQLWNKTAEVATGPFGINANSWPQNKSGSISHESFLNPTSAVTLFVEDNYTFDRNGHDAHDNKMNLLQEFIKSATTQSYGANTWYIGYSSFMTQSSGLDLIPNTPHGYAMPTNGDLEKLVRSQGGWGKPASVGTLVMDFPEEPTGSLIQHIIYTNSLKKK